MVLDLECGLDYDRIVSVLCFRYQISFLSASFVAFSLLDLRNDD